MPPPADSLCTPEQKDGRLGVNELQAMYEELGYKPRKQTEYGVSEVEDIIWEVDEDANGYIDWENFVQMYIRCRKDKSGKEPTRLYNLIEFMVCDKDGGGTMSEDECMEILFHRFGQRAPPSFRLLRHADGRTAMCFCRKYGVMVPR